MPGFFRSHPQYGSSIRWPLVIDGHTLTHTHLDKMRKTNVKINEGFVRFNAQKPNTRWNATRSVKRNQNSHKIKFQEKGWMAGWLDGWAGEWRLLSGFGTPTTICNGHRTMDNGHVTRQERVRVPLDPGTRDTFLAPRRRDSSRVWVGSALRERWQSSSRSVGTGGCTL